MRRWLPVLAPLFGLLFMVWIIYLTFFTKEYFVAIILLLIEISARVGLAQEHTRQSEVLLRAINEKLREQNHAIGLATRGSRFM